MSVEDHHRGHCDAKRTLQPARPCRRLAPRPRPKQNVNLTLPARCERFGWSVRATPFHWRISAEMATALDQPTGGTARRSAGISAVLDVLDALDRHGPVTLAQLSRETGVAKSTLHRVCSTMGARGWIARDSNSGNIELGPRVAWLARANPASAADRRFLRGRAWDRRATQRDHMPNGPRRLRECVRRQAGDHPSGAARHGRGQQTAGVRVGLGARDARRPARARGRGHVQGLGARDPHRQALAGTRGAALRSCARRGGRGYAENVDETALGLHCLAVPVGPPGRVAGAITLCVPSGRMDAARKRKMLPDLRRRRGPSRDRGLRAPQTTKS